MMGGNLNCIRFTVPGEPLFNFASSSKHFRPLLPSLLDHPAPTGPTLARHFHELQPTPATDLPSLESSHHDDDDDDDEIDGALLSDIGNIKLPDRSDDCNTHVHAFEQDEDDGMHNNHIEDHPLLYTGVDTEIPTPYRSRSFSSRQHMYIMKRRLQNQHETPYQSFLKDKMPTSMPIPLSALSTPLN